MSIYPCDIHGSRVQGPLESAYATLLRGSVRYTRKLRLCPDHLDEILRSEHPRLHALGPDGEAFDSAVCDTCAQIPVAREALDAVFVTAYRRGADRADYFAQLCRPCGDQLVETYELTL